MSLTNAESAHDCLFSPTRIATTGCQYYFLFIGRMSRSEKGRNVLDQCSILGHFTELLAMRSDLYLKLVISCLDYSSMEWGSRYFFYFSHFLCEINCLFTFSTFCVKSINYLLTFIFQDFIVKSFTRRFRNLSDVCHSVFRCSDSLKKSKYYPMGNRFTYRSIM